jgi:hypothetical protein
MAAFDVKNEAAGPVEAFEKAHETFSQGKIYLVLDFHAPLRAQELTNRSFVRRCRSDPRSARAASPAFFFRLQDLTHAILFGFLCSQSFFSSRSRLTVSFVAIVISLSPSLAPTLRTASDTSLPSAIIFLNSLGQFTNISAQDQTHERP